MYYVLLRHDTYVCRSPATSRETPARIRNRHSGTRLPALKRTPAPTSPYTSRRYVYMVYRRVIKGSPDPDWFLGSPASRDKTVLNGIPFTSLNEGNIRRCNDVSWGICISGQKWKGKLFNSKFGPPGRWGPMAWAHASPMVVRYRIAIVYHAGNSLGLHSKTSSWYSSGIHTPESSDNPFGTHHPTQTMRTFEVKQGSIFTRETATGHRHDIALLRPKHPSARWRAN